VTGRYIEKMREKERERGERVERGKDAWEGEGNG